MGINRFPFYFWCFENIFFERKKVFKTTNVKSKFLSLFFQPLATSTSQQVSSLCLWHFCFKSQYSTEKTFKAKNKTKITEKLKLEKKLLLRLKSKSWETKTILDVRHKQNPVLLGNRQIKVSKKHSRTKVPSKKSYS